MKAWLMCIGGPDGDYGLVHDFDTESEAREALARELKEPTIMPGGDNGLYRRHDPTDARPWTYCVDALPTEPGRYEAALVILARAPYTVPRGLEWFVGEDGSKGWIGEGEGICYAWRPVPELPRPRRRDLTEWPLLGSYLEGLEP